MDMTAGWAHSRETNQCIGVLKYLFIRYIIAFHKAHHLSEEDHTLTSTNKHVNSMEKICLENILKKLTLKKLNRTHFGAENLVRQYWTKTNKYLYMYSSLGSNASSLCMHLMTNLAIRCLT